MYGALVKLQLRANRTKVTSPQVNVEVASCAGVSGSNPVTSGIVASSASIDCIPFTKTAMH